MKTMLKLTPAFVSFCGILFPVVAFSQTGNMSDADLIRNYIAEQIRSPEVAALERYGNFPVSEATGIPEISIPVYTVRSGSLELPITLSYHIGGNRVNDVASWVGLGWTLNPGGAISRNVRGVPDAPNHGWFSNQPWPYDTDTFNGFYPTAHYQDMLRYFEQLIIGEFDSQSDQYNFNVMGLSGYFVYDYSRNLQQVPLSDNIILKNGNDYTIVDNMGVQYRFLERDTEYGYHSYTGRYISSWLLSEIVSADGEDSIRFNYYDRVPYDESTRSWTMAVGRPWVPSVNPTANLTLATVDHYSVYQHDAGERREERLLKSIEFRGGTVEFDIADGRKDVRDHCLREITVKNSLGSVIKSVEFAYDHFSRASLSTNKNDHRLKLCDVTVYGQLKTDGQKFSFAYHNEDVPSSVPEYKSLAQDHWGYYNGATSNRTLLGTVPEEYTGNSKADREPSESHMKWGILEKIVYPTGGYTIFETESNRVDDGSHIDKLAGGLRIVKIRSFDLIDPLRTISYVYEKGKYVFNPHRTSYIMPIAFNAGTHSLTPSPQAPSETNYGEPHSSGTLYSSSPISPVGNYRGSPVLYTKVMKFEGDTDGIPDTPEKRAAVNGMTVYRFDDPVIRTCVLSSYPTGWDKGHTISYIPVDWRNGYLREKEIYKVDDNPQRDFARIMSTRYEYTTQFGPYIRTGKTVARRYINQGIAVPPTGSAGLHADALRHYYTYFHDDVTGWYYPEIVTETEYSSPTDSISTITRYTYNMDAAVNRNHLVSSKSVCSSQDEVLRRTDYTYAYTRTGSPYTEMKSRNMLDYCYEEITCDGKGDIVSAVRVPYSSFTAPVTGSRMIKPSRVEVSPNGIYGDAEVTYTAYDRYGNLSECMDKAGIYTVYLWAWYGSYPIAVIHNARLADIQAILGATAINTGTTSSAPDYAYRTAVNALGTDQRMKNTLITTYSFIPLIGMNSFRDPSGKVTTYSYDAFCRLKTIFDEDINTIQDFNYNFKD